MHKFLLTNRLWITLQCMRVDMDNLLLFTPCSSTCCLDKAKECGLPSIQPFAEGELSMGWMPLQFAAVLLFGQV